MKLLHPSFKKNDVLYVILERTDSRYFAEIRSIDSNTIIGYETGRIIKQKEGKAIMGGVPVTFEAKETLIGNEKFGADEFECFLPNKKKVYNHFLMAKNLGEHMPKSQTIKREN